MAELKDLGAIVVIPARYESVRFPGKPLAPIAGRAMIARVYEQATKAERVARVIVANPLQVKAIAHAHVKTDKIDAGVLASLRAAAAEHQERLPGVVTLTVHL